MKIGKKHIVTIVLVFFAVCCFWLYSNYTADDTQDYEADILINTGGNTRFVVPAILSMYIEGDQYTIYEVHLPYGRSEYTDVNYIKNNVWNNMFLGYEGVDCEYLIRRKATEYSWGRLDDFKLDNGWLYASKNSNKYHVSNCTIVKQISEENLIKFPETRVASVFGYDPCKLCEPKDKE